MWISNSLRRKFYDTHFHFMSIAFMRCNELRWYVELPVGVVLGLAHSNIDRFYRRCCWCCYFRCFVVASCHHRRQCPYCLHGQKYFVVIICDKNVLHFGYFLTFDRSEWFHCMLVIAWTCSSQHIHSKIYANDHFSCLYLFGWIFYQFFCVYLYIKYISGKSVANVNRLS